MVTELFELVLSVITGFISALVAAFNGIVELFYIPEEGFTLIGTLLLLGLGMGIVYFAFRFIRSILRK